MSLWKRIFQWYQERPPWLRVKVLDLPYLAILLVAAAVLLYRLPDPEGSLIFDESYYVQNARVLLGQAVLPDNLPENILSGCDPNSEHPPLAKLIMAWGMSVFGESGVGWRLPSVILGLLGIHATYVIVRGLNGSRNLARLACFLLAFDNLYFVHSRIATLDIYMVSFALLGVALYIRRYFEFAGLTFGLATVCKINGLLWVFGLFLYELGLYLHLWWTRRKEGLSDPMPAPKVWLGFLLTIVFYLPFSFLSLGAMDSYYTEFQGPVAHVQHIFRFGTSLSREKGVAPQGVESTPLQWWLNEKSFDYLQMSGIKDGLTTPIVVFKGSMNMYLIAMAPFALIFCALEARRGNRLAWLSLCLFFASYFPMLITWIKVRRICYIFYMLPSMPALATAAALVLSRCPRWVTGSFMLASIYTFVYLFPFKGGV